MPGMAKRKAAQGRTMRKSNIAAWLGGAIAGAVALIAIAASPARAAWPERPITIIVHFPPGGANDLLGRLIAAELAPVLGQSVIVENRPGANGNIGLTAAARAAPDGYR